VLLSQPLYCITMYCFFLSLYIEPAVYHLQHKDNGIVFQCILVMLVKEFAFYN
jgi:hypothetical protein